MASTTLRQADPQDTVAIDPDMIVSVRADRDGQIYPSAQNAGTTVPAVDTTFRATKVDAAPGKRPRSAARAWIIRSAAAFVFAFCSAIAAAAWQGYGDRAQEMIARWTPHISLSSPIADQNANAAPPAPVVQANADNQVAAAPAQSGTDGAFQAATTAESSQLLQSMARDLAALGQQVGDLKSAMAQLKSGQEQMVRDMARVTEARASERAEIKPPAPKPPAPKPFNPAAIAQTIHPGTAPAVAAGAAAAAGAPATPVVHRPKPVAAPAAQATSPAPAPMMPMQTAPVPVR